MKLATVFSQLTYGELAQLNLGSHIEGEPSEANIPALVNHVNMGLIALYKRFTLKEGRLKIALQANRFTYPLTSAYAVSNEASLEAVKYLLDNNDEPFQDDIFKIERVYGADGCELGLNDESDALSCFTPSAKVLRFAPSLVVQDDECEVVYRASHPALVLVQGYIDPATTEVELPETHLEALLYYVASRVSNPTGMGQEFNAGNNWALRYERECQLLETQNLRVDQGSQNTRLERNGWV